MESFLSPSLSLLPLPISMCTSLWLCFQEKSSKNIQRHPKHCKATYLVTPKMIEVYIVKVPPLAPLAPPVQPRHSSLLMNRWVGMMFVGACVVAVRCCCWCCCCCCCCCCCSSGGGGGGGGGEHGGGGGCVAGFASAKGSPETRLHGDWHRLRTGD